MARDATVDSAINHWAPRLIANGVPYADFIEVTSGIERWDDWCGAWSRRGALHAQLGENALGENHDLSAGEHFVAAAVCCHFGKFLFVHDMDQMRRTHELAVGYYNKALPRLAPPGARVSIPFEGTQLFANLRRPAGISRPPLVVMIMGLDSAKEEMNAYEKAFLDRGLATLSVDGPGQGEAEYELALRPDFEVPVAAVIDWAQAEADIDQDRIGLWGVSFGGYHAPRVAAFEPRARACVALSGPFDFGADWNRFPDLSREAFRVRTKSATPEEAQAKAQAYTLEPIAGKITCPIYIVAGELDRIIPAEDARTLAKAVSGEVVLDIIEGANHVANNRSYCYRPQTADWMAARLYA